MAESMAVIAPTMPGYMGIGPVKDENGVGITVCYWQDEAAIAA